MDRLIETLRELTLCDGVSGQEGSVRDLVAGYLRGVGELDRDGIGNVCCVRRGAADRPRVMAPCLAW